VADPFSNAAAVTSRDRFSDFSMMHSTKPYNLLADNLVTTFYGLGLEPLKPWYDLFVTKIEQLREAGVFDHLISKSKKNQIQVDDSGPKVLTMKDLEIGFVIWLIMLGVSCLVFAGEHLMNCIQPFYEYWRHKVNNKPKRVVKPKKQAKPKPVKRPKIKAKLAKTSRQMKVAWNEQEIKEV
jgi:hypothetical protein